MRSGSQGTPRSHALVAMACATAAILLVTWRVADRLLRFQADGFRERAILYAEAIASTLPTWIARSEAPDLTALAHYAAFAGLLYVQVASGGTILLQVPDALDDAPSLGDLPKVGESRAALRSVRGRQYADVTVPYSVRLPRGDASSPGPYASGTLRVGLEASALQWAAGSIRALAAGLGALAWGLAAGMIALWTRRVSAGRPALAAEPGESPRLRTLGSSSLVLHVDEARLAVGGRSIVVTPKQLALLRVLMSEPGRTFSDKEIVAQAWPESPYADFRDVKQCVYLVRRRLTEAGLPGGRILANVPGIGYRVAPEAVRAADDRALDPPVIDA